MAHYAFIDSGNTVVDVITGIDENELIEGLTPEKWYENFKGLKCLRTSYNGNIRKNYAGIGYSYNEELDAFIPPKPALSWTLDEETCQWIPPTPMPEYDGNYDGKHYVWNEDELNWVLIDL